MADNPPSPAVAEEEQAPCAVRSAVLSAVPASGCMVNGEASNVEPRAGAPQLRPSTATHNNEPC